MREHTRFSVKPSMWRAQPIRYLRLVLFAIAGLALWTAPWLAEELAQRLLGSRLGFDEAVYVWIGRGLFGWAIFALGLWWLRTAGTELRVNDRDVVKLEGLLSRRVVQMRHSNVQNVYVDQSLLNRIMGCGTVGVSSAGQSDVEIVLAGLPSPRQVAETIQGLVDQR